MYPAGSTIEERSVHNLHIYTNSSLFEEFWYYDPIKMAWSVFFITIKKQMLSFYNTCLFVGDYLCGKNLVFIKCKYASNKNKEHALLKSDLTDIL